MSVRKARRRVSPHRQRAALILFHAGYSFARVARLLQLETAQVVRAVRRALVVVALVVAATSSAAAQGISIPNSFINGSAADADQVNANFAALAANALNRTGGTMTGSLTTQAVLPDADNTRDLGSAALSYKSAWFDGTLTANNLTVTGTVTGINSVPTGMMAHFNLSACPTGWTDRTSTQNGFYWVSKFSGQTSGTTVGTALTSGENRAVGQHNHTATSSVSSYGNILGWDSGAGDHNVSGGTAGQFTTPSGFTISTTVNNQGSVAGTNAPYAVYIACEKN